MKKDLISISDMTKEEIKHVIELAVDMKNDRTKYAFSLRDKILAMIFAKSSTRTRVSFETAMLTSGGHSMFLSTNDIQLGRGEIISDTAKVLSRYIDAIMIRTFKHSDVEELAKHSTVPVINALTDEEHPCQILADLMTIYEHKKTLDVKVCFIGDGNNVAASLALACGILDMECAIVSPKSHTLPESIRNRAKSVIYTDDIEKGAKNSDVVYTDVWASMGQENEFESRKKIFMPYQVNDKLVSLCKKDYIFLHCLPAHRGEEVDQSIIDGSHSVIFDEAENRMHAQKAVLYKLISQK